MNDTEIQDLFERVLPAKGWPTPLHVLEGVRAVRNGMSVSDAARLVGTTARRLQATLDSGAPMRFIVGLSRAEIDESKRTAATQILGQMMLGQAAELAFEDIYRGVMAAEEFDLKDTRESRNDTDYRVVDGRDRPVFRINIKFHGSQFRRAQELVGLDPRDCFALATYKIYSALQKQDVERLPYFFAIVGVPGLNASDIGAAFPSVAIDAVAMVHQSTAGIRKRDFEDAVVAYEIRERAPVFEDTYRQIRLAKWYMLSARKAHKLMQAKLFDRVFALRLRGFARVFRGAELDMHYSLSQDLTPLETFLETLRSEGLPKIATLMEAGEY